jgi:hypothetical protein
VDDAVSDDGRFGRVSRVDLWLTKELLDELPAEFCRDSEGDEHLDDGDDWPPLLAKSATRLFFINGVAAILSADFFFPPTPLSRPLLLFAPLLCDPLLLLLLLRVDLLSIDGVAFLVVMVAGPPLLLELDGRFLSVYGDRLGVECLSWCGDIASRRP